MNRSISLLWIEAGKILAANPEVPVSCPECKGSSLQVIDRRNVASPSIVEREMRCASCGAHNYLRLVRPLE
jgi:hypothetical protein